MVAELIGRFNYVVGTANLILDLGKKKVREFQILIGGNEMRAKIHGPNHV